MENHVNGRMVEFPCFDFLQEIDFVQIIHDLQALDVLELHHVGQVVHHQDVVPAQVVQAFYNVAADKAGTAGHNNHILPSFTRAAILAITPVVE